jgi:NADH-quinone oxidoreductase subunit J
LEGGGFGGNVERVARVLFTDFLWAFEITAVLLVIAVVGAVVLARRSGQRAGSPPTADAADAGKDAGKEVTA